ncbi:MAG: exo-alpha-sialidase [Caldilinea sp. CFX5]|nr:exo-alpha-sialidase [Caldilinea sp. CFX5]
MLLQMGDGHAWHFVNGPWVDSDAQGITVPDDWRRQDGDAIQGNHYAFLRTHSYADAEIRFEFQLANHADVGIILCARSESDFYLLHFPNCGQASRAQHFWVAFSHMGADGYLRHIKVEMVRRVASNSGLWLPAAITRQGDSIQVRIGRHGLFQATDAGLTGAGRMGLYAFMPRTDAAVGIRNLTVEGTPIATDPWRETERQPTNWFHPQAEIGGWQRPADLLRFPDGELLLSYSVQQEAFHGAITPLLTRSYDHGCTWSPPEPLQVSEGDAGWEPARLHLTPQGRLICLSKSGAGYVTAESADRGRTWSALTPLALAPTPPNLSGIHLGPQAFVNLADGAMLLLGYGSRPDLNKEGLTIYTWGSHHCQAFVCRSTDDGHTWSPWVNLDNAGIDTYSDPAHPERLLGRPIEGNLDLTEVCATQVRDGRILALIRPIYSPWMWESWSEDGGLTWTPCVRGPFPGYATPNLLRTQAGALLVAHRLPTMTINRSGDEGATWDEGTQIDSAIWVMGAMVEVAPAVVLYVYWDSFESLMRAQYLRVTPTGLEPHHAH